MARKAKVSAYAKCVGKKLKGKKFKTKAKQKAGFKAAIRACKSKTKKKTTRKGVKCKYGKLKNPTKTRKCKKR